ncbi:GSFK dehydrogenase, partial [Phaetusa simplex]|nr:GSFK dehydrogenase [Phaetusa simplex]
SDMAGFRVRSVLVTGANRGIGLGLVRHFLELPEPPQWVFAGCRDPKGQRAQRVLPRLWGPLGSHLVRSSWSRGLELRSWSLVGCSSGKRREDAPVLVPTLPAVAGAGPLPCATSMHTPVFSHPLFLSSLVSSPLLSSQAFLPLLKKAAQGSPGSGLSCSKAAIVNMSSSAGSIEEVYLWNYGLVVSYRCSKAALNMLTKCQSLGYREHGVLCVALHPGWVQTDMGSLGSQKPPVTVDESVRGMLKVLSSLSEKETGTFLNWEGKVVPW